MIALIKIQDKLINMGVEIWFGYCSEILCSVFLQKPESMSEFIAQLRPVHSRRLTLSYLAVSALDSMLKKKNKIRPKFVAGQACILWKVFTKNKHFNWSNISHMVTVQPKSLLKTNFLLIRTRLVS